jgi:hypothetical protein
MSTCPSAPQTALLCTPKKGNQAVLSHYAYEIWLHILVHQPVNFPYKAAGMMCTILLANFNFLSFQGYNYEVFEHVRANGTHCAYLKNKILCGLRRTLTLTPGTL